MLKGRHIRRRVDGEAELNLIPIMNLFIGLIPFLLLSAAFVRYGSIGTELPKASAEESSASVNSNQEVRFIVTVSDTSIEVAGYQEEFSVPVAQLQKRFELNDDAGLLAYLQHVKANHAKVGPSLFKATEKARYDSVIRVLKAIEASQAAPQIILAAGSVE